MNGYSRIRKVRTERSNSIDYSDISSVSGTTIPNHLKNHPTKPHHSNNSHRKENQEENNSTEDKKENEDKEEISSADGEIFGVILSRKCSVSSYSCTNNFLSEKQNSSSSLASFNGALKRTLSSLKRSSSVSEGYCRIHHRSDPPANDNDDHILMLNNTSQSRSTKKKGKIFNACKRILGF